MKEINNYHTNYHAFEESNLPFIEECPKIIVPFDKINYIVNELEYEQN